MSKLKHATLALATAGLLSTQAHAGEANVDNLQAIPVAAFNQTDLNAMFEQAGQPMQLAALSGQEMKETEGALVNFAVGGAIGLGTYVAIAYVSDGPLTWQGALFSIGVGAVTGGAGGALIKASGGGLAANVAWRPGMAAVSFGASQVRRSQGW